MLVAVDIGNTSIKFGAFVPDPRGGLRLVASERVESGTGIAGGVVPFAHFAAADEVVVAASAPEQLEHFRALTTRRFRVLGDDVRHGIPSSYTRPEELGLDRLAAVFGAISRGTLAEAALGAAWGRAVVVADIGTAVTVDALAPDGRFLAVAIAPGPPAAAAGLRARAPHLPPAPAIPGVLQVPARGTRDALHTGFCVGLAGLVDRLIDEALRLVPAGAPVVLTGGAAASVRPFIRTPHTTDEFAVLRGIAVLHGIVPVR